MKNCKQCGEEFEYEGGRWDNGCLEYGYCDFKCLDKVRLEAILKIKDIYNLNTYDILKICEILRDASVNLRCADYSIGKFLPDKES